MQNTPAVGIIIPIYNVERYLRECLDSATSQTYQNLQIILVDDASTDNSFTIAEEYFKKDTRITLIKREKNGGMGAARNTAIHYLSHSLGGGGGRSLRTLAC
ncbi:glycosyltransferase family 2 protein [Helicobacter cholecystus]|uniref:glycosyltransferase family 2 protein n=1 Tax=Helicobacter cholecystus TaxID=45498 RepID=UPI0027390CA2|nr:glycosyltransferase family A protein [Helicobacter cholecystus]